MEKMNKKRDNRFLPKSKKGAEMTIGTIIIIILALVVLVVLVYGFTVGWGNLWEKITGFGGGKVNVQSVVQSCQLACTTQAEYDWCTKTRKIIIDDGDTGKTKEISSAANGGINTCEKIKGQYGLESCGIGCGTPPTTTKSCKGSDPCPSFNSEETCVTIMGCSWS